MIRHVDGDTEFKQIAMNACVCGQRMWEKYIRLGTGEET